MLLAENSVSSSSRPAANKTTLSSGITANNPGLFSMQETYGSENNFERPKLYPNPLYNRFTIEFPSKYQGNFTVQIIDLFGRTYQIAKTKLKPGGSLMQVDIAKLNLKPSVYFLKIFSGLHETQTIKLIVQ